MTADDIATLRGPRSCARDAGQRCLIPDVLRGIALLAMLIASAAPFIPDAPWLVHWGRDHFNDLASPLFALVMGMSAQIVWNRGGSVGMSWARQALRGGVLIALGIRQAAA